MSPKYHALPPLAERLQEAKRLQQIQKDREEAKTRECSQRVERIQKSVDLMLQQNINLIYSPPTKPNIRTLIVRKLQYFFERLDERLEDYDLRLEYLLVILALGGLLLSIFNTAISSACLFLITNRHF